jgi:hypothetical protein
VRRQPDCARPSTRPPRTGLSAEDLRVVDRPVPGEPTIKRFGQIITGTKLEEVAAELVGQPLEPVLPAVR